MHSVEFHPAAVKELAALERRDLLRVRDRIEELRENPRHRGVVKIKGWDSYRVRVGNIRIVFKILEDRVLILIVRIGHRRDVYR